MAETVDPLPNGQALVWRLAEANGAWVEGPVSPLVHLDDLEMVADAAWIACRKSAGRMVARSTPFKTRETGDAMFGIMNKLQATARQAERARAHC